MSPLRVFYDGGCPRCAALAARERERGGDVHWLDLTRSAAELSAAGIDPGAALERLHAVDETGRVTHGAAALATAWERIPGRRWLAPLLRLPLLRGLAERAYDLVARRRRRA
ncbi:MAG: DUF393 domain-containing protein [Candidatus Krumholzibacteriia bacterium]|nr:DUF393 domain-containing protein [bacterium]MCB9513691.1 DUF393 domain-containing protein [Candidatus Latescibacterota bacterium]MCB9515466.1 DUF393 domain-containing protein [Candidatus Latescibacterota bacterium]